MGLWISRVATSHANYFCRWFLSVLAWYYCCFIADHVRKELFQQIENAASVDGHEIEVIEVETVLQCARKCSHSNTCDHVTITTGDDGKLICHLVAINDKHDKTFLKLN